MTMPSHDGSCSSYAVGALVEDADQLAAGIWPPSRYPCSFCRREFRSAQALGGHMNVHRRDRAHLRHYSPPPPSHSFSALPAAARDRSLVQNHNKYSANLSAQYTNQPLMEFKMPPISPSDLNDLSLATLYPSPSSAYPSHNTASLPLRSQQVASETAASLLQYPQGRQRCTSSDLDSFKPPPFAESTDITSHFGKTGMKEKSREIVTLPSLAPSPPSSNASSCTSLPSVVDAATRKRKFSILEVDEENCFIENDRKHLLRQTLTGAENPEEFLKAADIREAQTEAATDSSRMLWAKEAYACACGDRSEGDVDLELRLGRRQIFPKS